MKYIMLGNKYNKASLRAKLEMIQDQDSVLHYNVWSECPM